MKKQLRKLLEFCLPYLPSNLLNRILRKRPYLIKSLPNGFQLRWPYYLGDVIVTIDPRNEIENQMIYGDYDVSPLVRKYVKPGHYCIDVGANSGPVTLLLAKLVHPTGRVLSFEPGPPYYERLRTNLSHNPQLNKIVTTVNMGVSDAEGSLTWAADRDHPWNAGLSDITEGISVQVTTLDSFVKEAGWSRLDFVKIDVEGMELEVLKGSKLTLAKFRPAVLFETMEAFRNARGFDVFLEMENLFRRLGYRLYELTTSGELVEVNSSSLPDNTLALPGTEFQKA